MNGFGQEYDDDDEDDFSTFDDVRISLVFVYVLPTDFKK